MKITELKITNFRSIKDEITIYESDKSLHVLVGKNSAGKSNILRAINVFFNGEIDDGVTFNYSRDSHQSLQGNVKISVKMRLEPTDKWLIKHIDQNYSGKLPNDQIAATLSISPGGSFVYTFQGMKGKRVTENAFMNVIKNYVSCTYIPSIKDFNKIIYNGLMRRIVASSFQGYGKGIEDSRAIGEQKKRFKNLLDEVQKVLDGSSKIVESGLTKLGTQVTGFKFSLPYDKLEDFLGRLNFMISELSLKDPIKLEDTGSGIQSFSILSILNLLHQLRHKGNYKGTAFIWLIEEPEAFMHWDLQRKTRDALLEYSKQGNILITTHSPVFVHKSFYTSCYAVSLEDGTKINQLGPKDIFKVINGNLGVKLDEVLPVARYNLLVEGRSDREILLAALAKIKKANPDTLEDLSIHDCKSTHGIENFYGMYSALSEYCDTICLFDRDKAGMEGHDRLLKKTDAKHKIRLIPTQSNSNECCGIEDILGSKSWIAMVRHLDTLGLVTTKTQKGVITAYEYSRSDREKVKEACSKFIINLINKDEPDCECYIELMTSILAIWSSRSQKSSSVSITNEVKTRKPSKRQPSQTRHTLTLDKASTKPA